VATGERETHRRLAITACQWEKLIEMVERDADPPEVAPALGESFHIYREAIYRAVWRARRASGPPLTPTATPTPTPPPTPRTYHANHSMRRVEIPELQRDPFTIRSSIPMAPPVPTATGGELQPPTDHATAELAPAPQFEPLPPAADELPTALSWNRQPSGPSTPRSNSEAF
jgi:hypothetical protein